jgi:hypothetical protein
MPRFRPSGAANRDPASAASALRAGDPALLHEHTPEVPADWLTRDGEIVWEYVSPYFGPALLGLAGKKLATNWVYRAQPVPYDWVLPGTPHGEVRSFPLTSLHFGCLPSLDRPEPLTLPAQLLHLAFSC